MVSTAPLLSKLPESQQQPGADTPSLKPKEILSEFLSIRDTVKKYAKEVLDEVLDEKSYHSNEVKEWTTLITESCMKKLKDIADGTTGFKYIVNCIILQKKNSGFHTNTTCFWDAKRDGHTTIRWENQTMFAVLTVYCISLF